EHPGEGQSQGTGRSDRPPASRGGVRPRSGSDSGSSFCGDTRDPRNRRDYAHARAYAGPPTGADGEVPPRVNFSAAPPITWAPTRIVGREHPWTGRRFHQNGDWINVELFDTTMVGLERAMSGAQMRQR